MPKVFTQKEIRAQIYEMFDKLGNQDWKERRQLTALIKSHSRVDKYKLKYIANRVEKAIYSGRGKAKEDPNYHTFQAQLKVLEQVLDWIHAVKAPYDYDDDEKGEQDEVV